MNKKRQIRMEIMLDKRSVLENLFFPETDYLQIALDEASIYLIENYDKKGIKYRKE